MYGERICDCEDSGWLCWSPATDCPSAPPADRSACPAVGVSCEYEGGSCGCRESGWRCGRGVLNDPEDAGVPPGDDMPGAGTGAAGMSGSAGSDAAGQGAAGSTGAAGSSGVAGTAGAP
jgi:hypothetical protein